MRVNVLAALSTACSVIAVAGFIWLLDAYPFAVIGGAFLLFVLAVLAIGIVAMFFGFKDKFQERKQS